MNTIGPTTVESNCVCFRWLKNLETSAYVAVMDMRWQKFTHTNYKKSDPSKVTFRKDNYKYQTIL